MSEFWRREPYFTLDQAALLLAGVDPWDFDDSASAPRPTPPPVTHDIAYRVSNETGRAAKRHWASLIRAAQFGRLTPWEGKVTDRVERDAEPLRIPPDRIDPDACEFVTFDIERDELARWWLDAHDTLPYFLGGDPPIDTPEVAVEGEPKPSHRKLIAWMYEELRSMGKYTSKGAMAKATDALEIHGLRERNVNDLLKDALDAWERGNHHR